MSLREDHLTNPPLHHIRACFCEFWIKLKYLGNVSHHFHGKMRYFADSKSTYIIFKYILSSIWGLSLKENLLVPNFSLSIIIHPQKHPKNKRKCWKWRQTNLASIIRQYRKAKAEHGFFSSRWQSYQARAAEESVQAPDDLVSTSPVPPLIFLHTIYTALCRSSSTTAFWLVWLWVW